MLRVDGIEAGYGEIKALTGVSITVEDGEIVTLVGANGAGKTTLLRTISGLLPAQAGVVEFLGQEIHRLAPARRARLGVGHVPEGRQIFAPLSVRENLEMGAVATLRHRGGAGFDESFDLVYELFPRLKERSSQLGGTLSGGEQQMLAIGRALMGRPRFMMLDEPSLGLAPLMVELILDTLRRLNDEGVTILLVEQNAEAALTLAHRGYVMELGRVVHSGTSEALRGHDQIRDIYFGRRRGQEGARRWQTSPGPPPR